MPIVHQALLLRPWNKANQIHLVSHCLFFCQHFRKGVQFIVLTHYKLHCFIILVTWLMKDTWCMVMSPSKKSDCFLVLCINSAELGRELCKRVSWRYCIETENPPAPNFAGCVHMVQYKPMPCRDILAGSEGTKHVCTQMTYHLLHFCKEKYEKKIDRAQPHSSS